jgi:hypothetical protein
MKFRIQNLFPCHGEALGAAWVALALFATLIQPAQGTTVLFAFNGILFDGTRFALAATFGAAKINGEVFGASILASTTPPTLASTSPLAGSQFPLQLTGTPGINYAIQFSTNLALPNWTAFATNSPTNRTLSFTDPSATNKSRFYRAMKQ